MSIDRDDEISREAREILRLADHFERNPHLVSEARQVAENIRASADALERERQHKTEALNTAVRQVPKIWGQWMRRR
jgi:hypothetical protein